MKLSSFVTATIAISLLSTTEGLQDKNLRSVVPSISTATSSSSTAANDQKRDSTIRGTNPSAAASAATPSKDIQRHTQAVEGYYPSWHTGDETCINDGNAPEYMKADGVYYASSLEECCKRFYEYDMRTCVGSIPMDVEGFYPASQAVEGYYPSWGDETCINDGNAPEYMKDDGAYYASSLEECCEVHYWYVMQTCMLGPSESISPTSSEPTQVPTTSPIASSSPSSHPTSAPTISQKEGSWLDKVFVFIECLVGFKDDCSSSESGEEDTQSSQLFT